MVGGRVPLPGNVGSTRRVLNVALAVAAVLARYAGALVLRTDQHGDVTLRSDGERLWARTARGAIEQPR